MNQIQIAIIIFMIIIIVFILCYYWYDDIRFKKKVAANFNHATNDVLLDENKPAILQSVDRNQKDTSSLWQKDIKSSNVQAVDPLLNHEPQLSNRPIKPIADLFEDTPSSVTSQEINAMAAKSETIVYNTNNTIPLQDNIPLPIAEPVAPAVDSTEAFFFQLDQVDFTFSSAIDTELDLVIDIVFESICKIKIFPDITQFTNKEFSIYVLEKNHVWNHFEKGQKYYAKALKIVINFIDHEGIITNVQIENIYHELHKFVINNNGHIRCSDYEKRLQIIQEQSLLYKKIELNLELYLVIKKPLDYSTLNKAFTKYGLVYKNEIFYCIENEKILFSIANADQTTIKPGYEYNMLSIRSNLHFQNNPLQILDKIFDVCEDFFVQFESRLLTTNKQIINQREYQQLCNYLINYTESNQKKGIKLGSPLVYRMFNT